MGGLSCHWQPFFCAVLVRLRVQLAGMKSRVPWPTRNFNGGEQNGVLRRLRGLLVLVACYQSVASASACAGPTHCLTLCWVQVLRPDTPNAREFMRALLLRVKC